MRYIIASLLLLTSFTTAWSQGVVYVGDIDSIDRELLESPSLPAPLHQRASAQQPMPSGVSPMQMNRTVEQVKYTRAANTKQSPSKQEATKKSSFFSKMKPTWLFGEEKQMETPKQKDPFLAAQPRLAASPIGTEANYNNRVANAGFDQHPKQTNSINRQPSNFNGQQAMPSSKRAATNRPSNGPRNGGIAMRPPSKPTGLLNHLGLVDDNKNQTTKPVPSKPIARKQVAATPRKQVRSQVSNVPRSISNPFAQSKPLSKSPSQTISKPQSAEMQPHFVTDQVAEVKTPSLSSTTDSVVGFGTPEAKPTKDSMANNFAEVAQTASTKSKPSEEEFFFISDDEATLSEETVLSEAKVETRIELTSDLPEATIPMLVAPNESLEAIDESVEEIELPTPKPFVQANSGNRVATPMVMPTQNPFAKRAPIADASKQPSERSRALLSEAHSLAEYAASREEFTSIIQRCRYVLAIDDSQQAVDYANELAGWGLNKRGELLLDQGRNAEARVDFNDAINCDKTCWRAEHNLGVIKAQSGDFLIAKRHFDRTLELNPEFAKAYANRAALLVQSSNYQGALADYQRAIEVDPDLAMAHAGRGRVCHMLGNLEQALRHLDAAELLSPNDAMISQGRGDLLVDLGRYGQARQAYEQAIMLAPNQPNAYRNLAWMLATCPSDTFRNGEEALANAQLALELTQKPDDIALDTHAAALAAVGRFDEAIPMLKEAIKMAPKADAEVYTERLAMYEAGQAFTSVPVGLLKQATYISDGQVK